MGPDAAGRGARAPRGSGRPGRDATPRRREVTTTMMSPMSCAALAASLLAAAPAEGGDATRKSVVKVFSTLREPDLYSPWRRRDPEEAGGSGVVIEGKRILTNAHVVAHASRVFVQTDQSVDKVAATVEVISTAVDLAVLKVADPAFFDAHPPLARAAELPRVREVVSVYGFPQGGEGLSVTRGIVSRIEFSDYNDGAMGLRVQVDAAINPGNSGGPAVVDDRMVGLAFSRLTQSENIGYIIPAEEVELFLKDVADGKYDGKPALFDFTQPLENPALRARLKLDRAAAGVMVPRPYRDDPAYPLKPWDVIARIGDADVDNSGKVRARDDLRLDFRSVIQRQAKDGTIRLGLIRDGRRLDVDLPVGPGRDLVLRPLGADYPSYLVWGPLVFATATDDFVAGFEAKEMADQWLPDLADHKSPLLTRRRDRPRFPGEELVVVSAEILPHRVSKGYEDPFTQVVAAVDGTPIRNLRHLAEVLRDAKGEFVVFTFTDEDVDALVFDRKEVEDATEEILSENGIRKAYSDDLKLILGRKE